VFEKAGVVESIESWQRCRMARNLSAHDYEIDYGGIAEHFNALHELQPFLIETSARFVEHCAETLAIGPATEDFSEEFAAIVSGRGSSC
jgi:hypothetical protein